VNESSFFGRHVFGRNMIKSNLPEKMADNWLAAMDDKAQIDRSYLPYFAEVLKNWAVQNGACHFSHWFQPWTGEAAEKHDSFLHWQRTPGNLISHLDFHKLLQADTDGSSFPDGGMRRTSSSLGVLIWNPVLAPFLWEEKDQIILMIPALLATLDSEPLDYAIALLRSEQRLNETGQRLLKLAAMRAERVMPMLGIEQEYFLIDRKLFFLRPDLVLTGRTIFGAETPKGQEMKDHYDSSISSRIMAFMHDFEKDAIQLGIPVSTHHNEVAPAQHETALLYERSSLACAHNLMLMTLMRRCAARHHLTCLFHEKPFARLNGSGKHCNWSLLTDTGLNLLDPSGDRFVFFTILTALLRAVYEHSVLLRSSVGSYQNDLRMGGNEAPSAIVALDLGMDIEDAVDAIIEGRDVISKVMQSIQLGITSVPPVYCQAERNRTAFATFNGNRFEFRAVGASQHPGWAVAVINTIVADSLLLILDEIEDAISHAPGNLLSAATPVWRKHLKQSRPIVYGGDHYSLDWKRLAADRRLPCIAKSAHSLSILLEPQTHRAFEQVLSPDNLAGWHGACCERYARSVHIECQLMIDLFRTQIFPAAMEYQKKWAKSIASLIELNIPDPGQRDRLARFSEKIQHAIVAIDELEFSQKQIKGLGWEAQVNVYCDLVLPKMSKAREAVDEIESDTDGSIWPLPKYRELLFLSGLSGL
jgi:glutamine synthetase